MFRWRAHTKKKLVHHVVLGSAVLAMCAPSSSDAQVFTWDGSNNDNFSSPPNWSGNNVPSGSIMGQIIFGPEGGGNHVINGLNGVLSDIVTLSFTGADGVYIISGGGSFGFLNGGNLLNDSALIQTINVDLVGNGASLVLDALADAITLNGAVDLSDTGGVALTVQGGNDTTINGVISGAGGSIVMNSAGTLTLTGVNTFTGQLTINSGTLRLDGDLADTISVTLANVASAILDLNGNNETIGTLSGGGATGGDIALGSATLTFGDSSNTSFGGVISGTGGITYNGTGTFTLSGTNSYTGLTSVDAGELVLNGVIGGSLFVNSGARLSGVGSIADNLTTAAGTTVAPGNSIGTMTVGGDFTLQSGSTYEVELAGADGSSDLLDVTGSATLENGSTIEVTVGGEQFLTNGDTFIIIDADGGVIDNGATVTTTSAILDFEIQRIAGFINGDMQYALQAVRSLIADVADPGNNAIIAAALDGLVAIADADPTGEVALLLAELDTLDTPALNEAISQLSQEPYDAATTLGINDTRRFNAVQSSYLSSRRLHAGSVARAGRGLSPGALASASNDPRLMLSAMQAQAEQPTATSPYGGYVEFIGAYNELETETNRTGYTAHTLGGQAGIDTSISEHLLAGVSFGYYKTEADLNDDRGLIEVETVRVGPYVSYDADRWSLEASLTAGFSRFDAQRNIPALGRTAHSDYDGYDLTSYIAGEYAYAIDDRWSVAPTAAVQYAYFDFDRYTETGAAGANLSIPARSTDSLLSRLGLSLRHHSPDLDAGDYVEIYAGWEHEFIQNDDLEAAFAGGGGAFSIRSGNREENSLFYGAAFATDLISGGEFYMRIDGDYSDGALAIVGVAGFSIRF